MLETKPVKPLMLLSGVWWLHRIPMGIIILLFLESLSFSEEIISCNFLSMKVCILENRWIRIFSCIFLLVNWLISTPMDSLTSSIRVSASDLCHSTTQRHIRYYGSTLPEFIFHMTPNMWLYLWVKARETLSSSFSMMCCCMARCLLNFFSILHPLTFCCCRWSRSLR